MGPGRRPPRERPGFAQAVGPAGLGGGGDVAAGALSGDFFGAGDVDEAEEWLSAFAEGASVFGGLGEVAAVSPHAEGVYADAVEVGCLLVGD